MNNFFSDADADAHTNIVFETSGNKINFEEYI